MEPVILLSVAVALLLFGSISRRAERSVLTPPLWFVLVGFGLNRLGLIDLALTGEGIRVLAELALVLVLFTDAARIDLACLRREESLPLRLPPRRVASDHPLRRAGCGRNVSRA